MHTREYGVRIFISLHPVNNAQRTSSVTYVPYLYAIVRFTTTDRKRHVIWMHVNWMPSDLDSVDSCSWILLPGVPKFDRRIPTATVVQLIRVGVKLNSLNFAIVEMVNAFILRNKRLRYIIIHFNLWLWACNHESLATRRVVKSSVLICLVK